MKRVKSRERREQKRSNFVHSIPSSCFHPPIESRTFSFLSFPSFYVRGKANATTRQQVARNFVNK